jgi:hypothetical protein
VLLRPVSAAAMFLQCLCRARVGIRALRVACMQVVGSVAVHGSG